MNLLNILLWTGLSIFIFQLFVRLAKWQAFRKVPPFIVTTVVLILILQVGEIPYETYQSGTSPLLFLLTPATIALAYPLYKNIDIIRKNKSIVMASVVVATVVSLISAWGIGELFQANHVMNASIALKSVTTPVAVEISRIVGGIPSITACMVVFTGIFGGMTGHAVLSALRIRDSLSVGLAIGAASHVFGTARCLVKGEMEPAAVSVLALVLVALCTAVVAPLLFYQGW